MKLLLALASPVLLAGPGTGYYDGLPPDQYRGAATVTLRIVHPGNLESACRTVAPEGLELKGCARADWLGRRYIIMPDTCSDGKCDATARILAHEIAHTKGWPWNHPL